MKVNGKPYRWLLANRDKRFNYMFGGAGSGKSWVIAQYLLTEKFAKEKNIGTLVLRRTRPDVKASCYRLFHTLLGMSDVEVNENKTDLLITGGHGNFVSFNGVDNIEKKKSLEGINYVWVEETTELTRKELIQLNLRCRAINENGINQLFYSFNPVDPVGNAHLKETTDTGDTEDTGVLILLHKDNKLLSPEEHQQIENLADQDEEYDKIYRLGQWATPTNLIYSNWMVCNQWPDDFDETVYGLDFGFNNPTALIEVNFRDKVLYERELIYESKLTNTDVIVKLKELIPNKNSLLIADSAEPDRIQEIRNAGFNVHACKKGKDSVRHGIDTVKSQDVRLHPDSLNLKTEKRGYKWKVDKDENVLDEPVKIRDHLMDAERYIVDKMLGKIKASIVFVDDEDEYDEETMWS